VVVSVALVVVVDCVVCKGPSIASLSFFAVVGLYVFGHTMWVCEHEMSGQLT
jgi:hypothetical protein